MNRRIWLIHWLLPQTRRWERVRHANRATMYGMFGYWMVDTATFADVN